MDDLTKHCMCGCIYLEAECPNCNKVTDADRIEELEAKLAKAVDIDLIEQAVSDVLSEGGSYREAAEYVARTTLAELKGQNDE